jgi:C4-dicarboxylate transporter DctM subunit
MNLLILVTIGVMLLMLAEVPVAFAFCLGSFLLAIIYGLDLPGLVMGAIRLLNAYIFLTLPLFILLGTLMNSSGLATRLIAFVNSIVGRMKGGLGIVLIVTNTIFGAMCGIATSALATLGTIMIPEMEKAGYPKGHSTGFAVNSCVLSLLIPPSGSMILFGFVARVSIPLLFAATLIPGLILAVLLSIVNVIMCRNMTTIKLLPKASFLEKSKEVVRTGKKGFFVILMPVVILGGLYSGVFTPTEAASIAVVYALIIGLVVYRTLKFRQLWEAVADAGRIAGTMIIVFFFFFIMSRVLISEQVPSLILDFMLSISDSQVILLLLLNVVLFITGMFMEDTSGLLLAAIFYLPVAKAIGVDPIHFGAIVGVNLGLGLITPPVAPILYFGGVVAGGLPLREYVKPVIYGILFGYIPVLAIVTYVPAVSLTLPNLIMALSR